MDLSNKLAQLSFDYFDIVHPISFESLGGSKITIMNLDQMDLVTAQFISTPLVVYSTLFFP